MIDERRKNMQDPNFRRDDFIDIMLKDDLFCKNDKAIIDECMAFLFAGTQTTAINISETFHRLTQQKDILQKVREELNQYFKVEDFKKLTKQQWKDMISYESVTNLKYMSNCLNETFRVSPSVRVTSDFCFTEDIVLAGYTIPKGQDFNLMIYFLHRDPDQWIEPEKYIPDRFDPESKWSLTPKGTKRNPFAFAPFLGGKRICLGKTFAEAISRIVVSMIFSQVEFDFVNPIYNTANPTNGLF